MRKVRQYVKTVSRQINDQRLGKEYTRWIREDLIEYLNGALSELACYRPEDFTSIVARTLVAGHKQTASDTTKTIVNVQSNADGSVVHEGDVDLIKAYAPYDCCNAVIIYDAQNNPIYKARSYGLDPKDARVFYVSPAVPQGLTPSVNLTIVSSPVYTLADWEVDVPVHDKYRENILDYMMGRAYDIDTESPMSRSNADKHLGRFYTAMGVKYKYESAFKAGNYNGAVGDGDPRARI